MRDWLKQASGTGSRSRWYRMDFKEVGGTSLAVVMNGLGFNKAGGTGQKRRSGAGVCKKTKRTV